MYRTTSGNDCYELAASCWKDSDPEGVNAWFMSCLDRRTPRSGSQLRQLIRLLKSFCKNRPSCSLPSGFVLTVLVEEQYRGHDARLDSAMRQLMDSLLTRLRNGLKVRHPVVDEWLVGEDDDSKTRRSRELLDKAKGCMAVLDRPNCTRSMALKAWKKVFATDYFDNEIASAENDEKRTASAAVGALGLAPKPYGQVG